MTKEHLERMKELLYRLSLLSAEMLGIFEEAERTETAKEEVKKSPRRDNLLAVGKEGG